MKLTAKNIIGLAVYTQSGTHLGKVADFSFDTETQTVTQYTVKRSGLITDLWPKELLIHPDQVISLTDEKMVVDDNTIAGVETKKEPVPVT